MQESLYIRQRMQETLYPTVDAAVSLSGSGVGDNL